MTNDNMTIQEAVDNYKSNGYSRFFDEPPYLISYRESFDCNDYWISPDGYIISCGFAEHKVILEMLSDMKAINIIDERDAELQGWVKCSGGISHIVDFPVKKAVKDILLIHFAMNNNKIWLGGGHYSFDNPYKLEKWLDGWDYNSLRREA